MSLLTEWIKLIWLKGNLTLVTLTFVKLTIFRRKSFMSRVNEDKCKKHLENISSHPLTITLVLSLYSSTGSEYSIIQNHHAETTDRVSRVIFPLAFILFNFGYYTYFVYF